MIQALQACCSLHPFPQALPGAIHIQGFQPCSIKDAGFRGFCTDPEGIKYE
jgi:hypothetical protein